MSSAGNFRKAVEPKFY
ncbi:hypothetical protein Bhyg_11115 [Pseudolycoriella hygida]|uniref:Uncharacterized protein n=1 Tax=Pseudolycoriella hygida TaxID=35572 RepID=A0A9Q0MUX8_9DIPT|nr:hypothetical protein Bhyg_11115 [Pseudolycoriella hygida]